MVVLGQYVLGSLSPWAQTGFLNRNCGNGNMYCLYQASSKQLVVPWGAGVLRGLLSSPPHRLHSKEPTPRMRWGLCAHHAGHSGGYLVLVKLIHSLCDPITVIQPQHPGKLGDEASIPWGRKESGCCPRSPSLPTCSLGCWEACPGSFTLPNIGQMGMGVQVPPASGKLGSKKGRTCGSPRLHPHPARAPGGLRGGPGPRAPT